MHCCLSSVSKTSLCAAKNDPPKLYASSIILGLYYGVSICLVSFASAMAVVTLNIHYRGLRGYGVPPLIRTIVLGYLAKYFLIDFINILVALFQSWKGATILVSILL